MARRITKQLLPKDSVRIGKKLLSLARRKVVNAFAPHSKVKVSCAILSNSGRVFFGVNVENDSLGLTICAERSALSAMVTELGKKAKVFALGVHAPKIRPVYPCGACRQALLPFVSKDTLFFTEDSRGEIVSITFAELLPQAFRLPQRRSLHPSASEPRP